MAPEMSSSIDTGTIPATKLPWPLPLLSGVRIIIRKFRCRTPRESTPATIWKLLSPGKATRSRHSSAEMPMLSRSSFSSSSPVQRPDLFITMSGPDGQKNRSVVRPVKLLALSIILLISSANPSWTPSPDKRTSRSSWTSISP